MFALSPLLRGKFVPVAEISMCMSPDNGLSAPAGAVTAMLTSVYLTLV